MQHMWHKSRISEINFYNLAKLLFLFSIFYLKKLIKSNIYIHIVYFSLYTQEKFTYNKFY